MAAYSAAAGGGGNGGAAAAPADLNVEVAPAKHPVPSPIASTKNATAAKEAAPAPAASSGGGSSKLSAFLNKGPAAVQIEVAPAAAKPAMSPIASPAVKKAAETQKEEDEEEKGGGGDEVCVCEPSEPETRARPKSIAARMAAFQVDDGAASGDSGSDGSPGAAPGHRKAPSKTMKFGATDKCEICGKTVYPLEAISIAGKKMHKTCFKCAHCSAKLSIKSFAEIQKTFYCKVHYEEIFKSSGGRFDKLMEGSNS